MSIPYEELHKAALLHVPAGTIKPTSAWIAIALHTIETAEDLKGRNSFLWLKCHSNITMRTLKHEYFLRNPIEEFELKFVSEFVSEKWQIKNLQKANPIPTSNVIVLRVFENERVDAENELEEQEKFVRNVKEQVHSGRGLAPDSAIVLDADVYEKEKKAVAKTSLKRKRLIADDDDDEDAAPSASKPNAQPVDVDSDGQVENGQFDNGDTAEYDNSTFDEAMDTTEQRQQILDDRRNKYEIHGFLARLYALSERAQARFNESPWTRCGSCLSPMYLQPWTLFGQDHSALCTRCSRTLLTNQDDLDGLKLLQHLCREQSGEKNIHRCQGIPQNMHDDAPLDHSLPLEEYLEVAEATRDEEAKGSEDDGRNDDNDDDDDDEQMDQEGDAIAAQDKGEEQQSESGLPASQQASESHASTPSPHHADDEIDGIIDHALSQLRDSPAPHTPDHRHMSHDTSNGVNNSYTLFDHLVNDPDPLRRQVTGIPRGTYEHEEYDTASEASFATAGEDVLSNGDSNHVRFHVNTAANDDAEDLQAQDEWETESESAGASETQYTPQHDAEVGENDDE